MRFVLGRCSQVSGSAVRRAEESDMKTWTQSQSTGGLTLATRLLETPAIRCGPEVTPQN